MKIKLIIAVLIILIIGLVAVNYTFVFGQDGVIALSNRAISHSDYNICKKVIVLQLEEGFQPRPRSSVVNACYETYGTKMGDIRACDAINVGIDGADNCYTAVAAKTKDISICEKIKGEKGLMGHYNKCVTAVVSTTGNKAYCAKIENELNNKTCMNQQLGSFKYENE